MVFFLFFLELIYAERLGGESQIQVFLLGEKEATLISISNAQ